MFQSGVIPGDTDFQVYRDYAGHYIDEIDFLPGIDMVAISKGHVYHTELDDVAHIDAGAMQRTWENVLAIVQVQLYYCPVVQALLFCVSLLFNMILTTLAFTVVQAMASSRKIESSAGPDSYDEVTFFDILGLTMVVYSQKTAFLLDSGALLALTVWVVLRMA